MIGELHLAFDALVMPNEPGLTLTAYSADPGTPSEDGLRLLASWAATEIDFRHKQGERMNIEPSTPTSKNPPEQFAGDVWLDPIALPHEADQRMTVATVRFAPGARTAWHSHARGQYLRVTQGVARFGGRDGTIIEVHAGETLYTPPGEEHWHAAAPRMLHGAHRHARKRRRPGDDDDLARAHHRRRVQRHRAGLTMGVRRAVAPRPGRRLRPAASSSQAERRLLDATMTQTTTMISPSTATRFPMPRPV